MTWNIRLALSLAFLIGTVFAGCLDAQPGPSYQAYGSKGNYTTGFAYDGKGIVPFDGSVYLDVNDQANKGFLVAKGKIGPTPFEVLFDRFAPAKPFHDGGIASNLIEHGDSGVGDTSIPRVELEMAGWGKATVRYADKAYNDPVTGNETWTAHFMVIRNGVRDNATGAIYADSNRTAVYDPLQPANGTSAMGDHELHLVLRSGVASANGSEVGGTLAFSATVPETAHSAQSTLFAADRLGARANISFQVTDSGVGGTNVTFTLRAPSGDVVLEQQLGDSTIGGGTSDHVSTHVVQVNEVGDYSLSIAGRMNPGGRYEVRHAVHPPEAVVLNMWWEDVLFGLQAEERGTAQGLVPVFAASSSSTAAP